MPVAPCRERTPTSCRSPSHCLLKLCTSPQQPPTHAFRRAQIYLGNSAEALSEREAAASALRDTKALFEARPFPKPQQAVAAAAGKVKSGGLVHRKPKRRKTAPPEPYVREVRPCSHLLRAGHASLHACRYFRRYLCHCQVRPAGRYDLLRPIFLDKSVVLSVNAMLQVSGHVREQYK